MHKAEAPITTYKDLKNSEGLYPCMDVCLKTTRGRIRMTAVI